MEKKRILTFHEKNCGYANTCEQLDFQLYVTKNKETTQSDQMARA
jgi:hypothetical protein